MQKPPELNWISNRSEWPLTVEVVGLDIRGHRPERARPHTDRPPPDARADWSPRHLHGPSAADGHGPAATRVRPSGARSASGKPGRLTTIHSASSSKRSGSRHRRRSRKLSAPTRLKSRVIGHCLVQRGQRLHRIVRAAVRPRRVKVGYRKARIQLARKLHHGKPVGERRGAPSCLQRLAAHRSEQNAVQVKYICRRSRNRDMAVMRWIETAAEEGYAHGNLSRGVRCILTEGGRRSPC